MIKKKVFQKELYFFKKQKKVIEKKVFFSVKLKVNNAFLWVLFLFPHTLLKKQLLHLYKFYYYKLLKEKKLKKRSLNVSNFYLFNYLRNIQNKVIFIISITLHNIFLTVVQNKKIFLKKSMGWMFKKKQRSLPLAMGSVLKAFGLLLSNKYGIKNVVIHLQGVQQGRKRIIFTSLQQCGIFCLCVKDHTKIPFNGTKKKKKKR